MKNEIVAEASLLAALEWAATHLGAVLSGETRYGWHKKSAGRRATIAGQGEAWLSVKYRQFQEAGDKLWTGTLEAGSIVGVRKPRFLATTEWRDGNLQFRADLTSFVPHSVCSATPELRKPLSLSSSWFSTLRDSLENLSVHNTARVNTRQDLITRRIEEQFGRTVDTRVSRWVTAHGDLHWANLTQPDCWILDWEAWGRGPSGLDAAFLLCFSLLEPEIAAIVQDSFSDCLTDADGIRSQLFACAELIRMTDLYGDHAELAPRLREHANALIPSAARL